MDQITENMGQFKNKKENYMWNIFQINELFREANLKPYFHFYLASNKEFKGIIKDTSENILRGNYGPERLIDSKLQL